MDVETVTQVIGAVGAAVGVVDKIAGQVRKFLEKRPDSEPEAPPSSEIKVVNQSLVVKAQGKTIQTITAAELTKLPQQQLQYVKALEAAMDNHFAVWTAVYPELALKSGIERAKLNQELKQVLVAMKSDLEGVLSFLETCGVRLDDHYLHIRQLVKSI